MVAFLFVLIPLGPFPVLPYLDKSEIVGQNWIPSLVGSPSKLDKKKISIQHSVFGL